MVYKLLGLTPSSVFFSFLYRAMVQMVKFPSVGQFSFKYSSTECHLFGSPHLREDSAFDLISYSYRPHLCFLSPVKCTFWATRECVVGALWMVGQLHLVACFIWFTSEGWFLPLVGNGLVFLFKRICETVVPTPNAFTLTLDTKFADLRSTLSGVHKCHWL